MHLPAISSNACKSLALIAQCLLAVVDKGHVRLSEIKMLCHENSDIRELAKSAVQSTSVTVALPEHLSKLPTLAAEARMKRARNELSKGTTNFNRGK